MRGILKMTTVDEFGDFAIWEGMFMYMRIKKSAFALLLMTLIVVSVGCSNEAKYNESQGENAIDVMEVMNRHTDIIISNVSNSEGANATADVQITMPDISKIYADLVNRGKAENMTLEEIVDAISEYTKNEEYLFTDTTTALVSKDGSEWVLSTDDYIEELTNQQIDALLVLMLNNIETIEIGGGAG